MRGAVREGAGAARQDEVHGRLRQPGRRDRADLQLVIEESVPMREGLVVDLQVFREHPVAQVALEVALVRAGREVVQDARTGRPAQQAVVVLRRVVADHHDLLHRVMLI